MKFRFGNINFKEKFVKLTQILEAKNLVCVLERQNKGIFFVVSKFPPIKQRKSYLGSSYTRRGYSFKSPTNY